MTDSITIQVAVAGSTEPAKESLKDLKRFVEDPYFVHYLGMINPPRPGVSDCVRLLEYTYFAPDTPRNALLHVRAIDWMGILWIMISLPVSDIDSMNKVVNACRLRVANGVPYIFDGAGTHSFPVSNDRIFTLENIRDHPIYKQGEAHDS